MSASTVNTRLDAAAVTTRVESSPLTAMPNGVASASSRAGSAGGSGSSSKNAGAPQPAPHATRVMRLRKARFSSSAMPWPSVPALPLASLRASVWAMNTRPVESAVMP